MLVADLEMDGCRFPDVAAITAYGRRCRCPRCRTAWSTYTSERRKGLVEARCVRCRKPSDVVLHVGLPVEEATCFDCMTADEEVMVIASTFLGRYGLIGKWPGPVESMR